MGQYRNSDESGGVEIGLHYPRFQLAKALKNAWATGDSKAERKAEKWQQVLEGMFSGELAVGSRTPVAETPAWVTLEVVTGGFATGNMLAGGELRDHELDLARELGIPVDIDTRARLNGYFLSEEGQSRLGQMIETGRFRLDLPEEGALLVIAWLLNQGDLAAARRVLDVLMPLFDRLRFFPMASEELPGNGEQVFLQDVGQTLERLRRVAVQKQVEAQAESIGIWRPLYDRAAELLLDTVDGEPPRLVKDPSGGEPDRVQVAGGRPCQSRPPEWDERAAALLEACSRAANEHRPSRRWRSKDGSFQRFLRAIAAHADGNEISEGERSHLRTALAHYLAKWGAPDSETHRARRGAQDRQCAGPRYHEIAELLARRLEALPKNEGLHDPSLGTAPIGAPESRASVPEGTPIPPHLSRKVGRALVGTIQELIESGYVSSADLLAEVLPQITSEVRASSIEDGALRRIFAHVYRAFRRRRSLLLLNLESQVRLEELPWVGALDGYRAGSMADRTLAKTVMHDVTCTALTHFPQAILPNKLVRELRALAKQAGMAVPFVDEIAADIFMGIFSAKYARAAHEAGELLAETLYERYYGIDYAKVLAVAAKSGRKPSGRQGFWSWLSPGPEPRVHADQSFADLCSEMAGSGISSDWGSAGWSVAGNGMVIEQQQIVTTQNLAALFRFLDLREALRPALPEMANQCFRWICARQQLPLTDYHARLIMMKNTAYAWRQMIFFLALVEPAEQRALAGWMVRHLAEQSAEFQSRFRPAFMGLSAAIEGRRISDNGGRRLLGWTLGRHWMMPEPGDGTQDES